MVVAALAAALLGLVPSFHLVLSDGNFQLEGQASRIAELVAKSVREMGIEMTWSFDPSDPSLPVSNVVNVIVLPHSSFELSAETKDALVARLVSDADPAPAQP
jgi:hypothetical protein